MAKKSTESNKPKKETETKDIKKERKSSKVSTRVARRKVNTRIRGLAAGVTDGSQEALKPSNYELLSGKLSPLLGSRKITDLEKPEVKMLAQELGVANTRLASLVQAHRLSKETDLPAEVLYAFARSKLPLDLEHLLSKDSATLRTALESAAKDNIISALPPEAINDVVRSLENLRPTYLNLRDVAALTQLKLPGNLVNYLEKQGIRTLGDIRAMGGLSNLEALPNSKAAHIAMHTLEAHADLSTLSTDLQINAQLIDGGYTSPAFIARTPRDRFIAEVTQRLPEANVGQMHEAAVMQNRLLNHEIAGNIINDGHLNLGNILQPLPPRPCQCQDCQSAVSPSAYVADLMDYALTHLQFYWPGFANPQPVNLQYLIDLLYQPFDKLPVSCGAAQDQVRQVRLCIEVLRKSMIGQTDLLSDNPSSAYPIKFAIAGDIDGDGREEVIVAPDWSLTARELEGRQESNALWVMDYDPAGKFWQHLSPIIGHPHQADVICGPYPYAAKFGFAADVDGDNRDEVVLAIAKDGEITNEFWIMKYDLNSKQWRHLSQVTHPFLADLDPSSANVSARFALAADVDGDNRAELIIALDRSGAEGRLFWVMDFDPATGQWRHLSPIQNDALNADLDPNTDDPTSLLEAAFVIAGDFDGDGRAELAINLRDPNNILLSRFFWILDHNPNSAPAQWTHMRYDLGGVGGSAYGFPVPVPARFGTAIDVDEDGRDELVIGIEKYGSADANLLWIVDYVPNEPTFPWQEGGTIDCSSKPTQAKAAITINSDGIAPPEIVVLPVFENSLPKNGLWVMERDSATQQWHHQSAIANHPLEADLDWSKATYPAQGVFRADVDGDGGDEIVIYPAPRQSLWVMKYNGATKTWDHLSPVINLAQAENKYLWAAYRMLLNQLGTSFEEIRLARTADSAERQALADRLSIILTSPRPDNLDVLLLDENTLTESKLEALFGLIDTTRDALLNADESKLQQWRAAYLRTIWLQQDGLNDVYAKGELPVIDPDIVTPDDIRVFEPTTAGSPAALWLKRRQWVDASLNALRAKTKTLAVGGKNITMPDLDAMLTALRQDPITYDAQQRVVWSALGVISDLDTNYEDLTGQDRTKADTAGTFIRDQLHLTPDSFMRLIEIRKKAQTWVAGLSQDIVLDGEWEEVYSILTQAIKVAFYLIWVQEETTWQNPTGQPIRQLFSPKHFWASLREPREGLWSPSIQTPYVDPELVTIKELPDSTVGAGPLKLWEQRRTELSNLNQSLQLAYENNGLESLLTLAFGQPPGAQTWLQKLKQLKDDLDSGVPAQSDPAQGFIKQQLYLSPEQFNRLINLKAKLDANSQPTKLEWTEVYALLTTAMKQRTLYPAWKTEETNKGLSYWDALKAHLPRWRAALEARHNWIQALASRGQAPIIDPDLITLAYLRSDAADAQQIYTERQIAITAHHNLLKNETEDLAGFKLMFLLDDSLGLKDDHLDALIKQRADGESAAGRLNQLSITTEAFALLTRMYRSLKNNEQLLADEWDAIYDILTQVWKRRQFADWRAQEIAAKLTHSPDYFQLPQRDPAVFPPPPPPEVLAWRATRRGLRDWVDTLQSRIDQDTAAKEGLLILVADVEEATLPILRDALVIASASSGGSLADRAKWLSERLLIDTQADGCQMTTRTAQAIETIQTLLWSARTGQLEGLDLNLYAPDFDKEWKWIGSYNTWRAAMLVYLYPENLLTPSLRKERTPAFRVINDNVRTNTRLNPGQAAQDVESFVDYYRDVCSLKLGATCEARMRVEGQTERVFVSMFALAEQSGQVYWCLYASEDALDGDWKYWRPIPNKAHVIKITGAVPYQVSSNERYICLFMVQRAGSEEKLTIAKLNLDTGKWTSLDLAVPDRSKASYAVVKQRSEESEPPHLAFFSESGAVSERFMNVSVSGWAGDPRILVNPGLGKESLDGLVAMLGISKNDYVLIGRKQKNSDFGIDNVLLYRIFSIEFFGQLDDLRWHDLGSGTFRGAFVWPVGRPHPNSSNFLVRDVVVYFENGGATRGCMIKATQLAYVSLTTLDAFATWLQQVFGLSMSDTSIEVGGGTFESLLQFYKRLLGYRDKQIIWDFAKKWQTDEALKEWKIAEEIYNHTLPNVTSAFVELLTTMLRTETCVVPVRQSVEVGSIFSGLDGLSVWVAAGAQSAPMRVGFDTASGTFTSILARAGDTIIMQQPAQRTVPRLATVQSAASDPLKIPSRLSSAEAQARASMISDLFKLNQDGLRTTLTYLEEAYYFVPILIALALSSRGEYLSALDWFRTVYDYTAPLNQRKIYPGLKQEEQIQPADYSQRAADWLLDPLNPHRIARTRRNSYTRFTLHSLVGCFLKYADAEFTRDTAESITRSRILYTTALELLDLTELSRGDDQCQALIGWIERTFDFWHQVPVEWRPVALQLMADLRSISNVPVLEAVLAESREVRAQDMPWEQVFPHLQQFLIRKKAEADQNSIVTLAQVLEELPIKITKAQRAIFAQSDSGGAIGSRGQPIVDTQSLRVLPLISEWVPTITYAFCVLPNPLPHALRLHAELNLYKIRTCCNIAGIQRQLELYSAPADMQSGLPVIGAGGQLALPRTTLLHPTPYRYVILIERAKQLVALAQQVESAFLSGLQQQDVKAYTLLKARHDVQLARAGVHMQNLRVQEAESGVDLAKLELDRSELEIDHYHQLLNDGLSSREESQLTLLTTAAAFGLYGNLTPTGMLGSISQATSIVVSRVGIQASYERRQQEWEYQAALAQQVARVASQQIRVAEDHVRVVGQERVIAEMGAENAEATVDFLNNEFDNVELYHWMSDVLEGVYRFFLQQATSLAQLASHQLAFERHETPPPFIQSDYWQARNEDSHGDNTIGRAPDRRGLTGSARLLQDIYQLDQYAFETNRRKLQLSKTISLAQMSPTEFQRFRETGLLRFATPMEMFDRDFPGHYLRLVHKVSISTIALIPPSQGIRATLTAAGLSRVVIGGDIFQTVLVRRDPQTVALSSPINATGLFELDPQPDMLAPFETMGVDASFEFRMPKAANRFDYSTIADILLTIEYTALNSFDYRQQVSQQLDTSMSAEQAFSFRNQFADQWYDLHNPELLDEVQQMLVNFDTTPQDFPPNLDSLKIQHVVLYFARTDGSTFEVPVTTLRFTEAGTTGAVGGEAPSSVDGVISTRRGNASSWMVMIGKSPYGKWELTLPNTDDIKKQFKDGKFQDILFVITYSGRTPEWPA